MRTIQQVRAAMIVAIAAFVIPGCELVATAFIQKEWVIDPLPGGKPDLATKAEIKMTRLIGRDAKVRKLNNLKNKAEARPSPAS